MKPVSAKATMSALVRRLFDEGNRPVKLRDGRIKIGSYYFKSGKRTNALR